MSRQDEDPHPVAASMCDVEFMNIQQARKAECIFVHVKNASNVESEKEKSGCTENSISDNLDHMLSDEIYSGYSFDMQSVFQQIYK